VALLVVALALLLCGCGGRADSPSTASASAAPLPTPSVVRDLKTGEQLSLRCGLSLTVPAGYEGYYAAGEPELSGSLDDVASTRGSNPKLPLQGFGLSSLAEQGEATLPDRLGMPRIAASADGGVSVYGAGEKLGTAGGGAEVAVVVRLPGRPIGLVKLVVPGEQATLEPREVLSQLEAMWRLFDIRGAELPPVPGA
jgi:hypothetical protein